MKETTAIKNDVQVIQKILERYMDTLDSMTAAVAILKAMQKETKHIHDGEVFYVHKDKCGTLVLTKESVAKIQIKEILKSYVEEEDKVQKCFVLLTVCTKSFAVKIEGAGSKIYSELMRHSASSERERKFQDNLKKAISASVCTFETYACSPGIDKEGMLQFKPSYCYYNDQNGRQVLLDNDFIIPAVGYIASELESLAKENKCRLGNKFEYVLFLGTIIRKLIDSGVSEKHAWDMVCNDYETLHLWLDSGYLMEIFEPTGAIESPRSICPRICQYRNLAKDEQTGSYWYVAGPLTGHFSEGNLPLANIELFENRNSWRDVTVGWFVR